jgi:beta-lactamase regulating signal transducer with metallopeptidase domain
MPLSSIRVEIADLFGKKLEPVSYFQLSASGNIQQPVSNAGRSLFPGTTDLLLSMYAIIVGLCIAVIVMQLIKILWLYSVSKKTKHRKGVILCNKSIVSPFSFFRWIFIPEYLSDREERESIIVHESIHVSQYHSFDNLLIELTAAVMWFNPLVWMMKKSLHLVHEYLADEGTLGTGIDRLSYQALLINQVTEERLVCLSSSFNNSLIKKRMIMMTKSKNNQPNKKRVLALLPLSVILLLTTAFLNGLFPEETKGSPAAIANFGQSGFERCPELRKIRYCKIMPTRLKLQKRKRKIEG